MNDIYSISVPFYMLNEKARADLIEHDMRGGKIVGFNGIKWITEPKPFSPINGVTYKAVKNDN